MIDVVIMASVRARREWLSRTLEASGLRIAGTAPSFPFLRSLLDELPADVAVVEVPPEPESHRDWVLQILDLVPIVLLTPAPDPGILHALTRTQRGGLLRADASPDQIVQAIQSTWAGLLTFDGTLMTRAEEAGSLLEDLTPRETEVLALLAEGLGNREIASRLTISEHTIKFHIRSILGKLGASSRTEAVTQGLRRGLIEL